jgi:membrane-bound ClpP family serine protease
MHWLLILTFILIGLIFMVLEVLVIPGFGFAGVIGFILVAVGVWQTYAAYGMVAGHLVLATTFLATVVTLVLSLRSKTWRKLMLSSSIDSKVNVIDPEKIKPGDTGKTVSRLAPMGKALINGEYYEVATTGDFVDQQTVIEVTRVEQNKITVKRKEQ